MPKHYIQIVVINKYYFSFIIKYLFVLEKINWYLKLYMGFQAIVFIFVYDSHEPGFEICQITHVFICNN